MRHILGAARGAVERKGTGPKMSLFLEPEPDHVLGAKGAGCSAPDILALERLARDIGRMFEAAGCRKMIGPRLRAARKLVVPAQLGHAHQRAFAVVAGEQTIVEAAQARLCARRDHRHGCQKGEFSCLEADVLHAQFPETRGKASPCPLKRGLQWR